MFKISPRFRAILKGTETCHPQAFPRHVEVMARDNPALSLFPNVLSRFTNEYAPNEWDRQYNEQRAVATERARKAIGALVL